MNAQVISFPEKQLMNLEEASVYIGIKSRGVPWSPQTLRNKLSRRQGPRCEKRFGRLVFKKADLDAYVRNETEVKEAYR